MELHNDELLHEIDRMWKLHCQLNDIDARLFYMQANKYHRGNFKLNCAIERLPENKFGLILGSQMWKKDVELVLSVVGHEFGHYTMNNSAQYSRIIPAHGTSLLYLAPHDGWTKKSWKLFFYRWCFKRKSKETIDKQYTRFIKACKAAEIQADLYSCKLMKLMGYDPLRLIDYFDLVPKSEWDLNDTHPTIWRRIEIIKKYCERM